MRLIERLSLPQEALLWKVINNNTSFEGGTNANPDILLVGTEPRLSLVRIINFDLPGANVWVIECDGNVIRRVQPEIGKYPVLKAVIEGEFPETEQLSGLKFDRVIAKNLVHLKAPDKRPHIIEKSLNLLRTGGRFDASVPILFDWFMARNLRSRGISAFTSYPLGGWHGTVFEFVKR